MNLSPKLINLLLSVKSLLELGDFELVSAAATRLAAERHQPEIDTILIALEKHRYADAANAIQNLLSDGTRLAEWTDPEITLLQAELERVKADLADLETEQAELEHQIARFQAAHNEALGEKLHRILQLRMRMLERQVKINPSKQESFRQARQDFEEFQKDQEIQQEIDRRSKWELTETEQAELKQRFRKASKLCHPDLVPAEHLDAATEMFRQLRKAYDEGDIKRVRELEQRATAGLFETTEQQDDNAGRRKSRLKAQIEGIRESLERSRAGIEKIKRSYTYQTMVTHSDWAAWFDEQAKLLAREIEKLTSVLESNEDET